MTQAAENKTVTANRKRLVLEALWHITASFPAEGGASPDRVNETLLEWIADGTITWPQATWPFAATKPYYGGTLQHLQQMERRGWVTKNRNGYRADIPAGRLRPRAADVLRLKTEDKSLGQIAEELGISRSLAGSLAVDPTGSRERERKRSYCRGCGSKKKVEATVCPKCQQRKAEELLPPDTFKVYIERAREEGVEILFGVTPDFRRVIRAGTWRAFDEHEVAADLSWTDGLTEFQDAIGVQLV